MRGHDIFKISLLLLITSLVVVACVPTETPPTSPPKVNYTPIISPDELDSKYANITGKNESETEFILEYLMWIDEVEIRLTNEANKIIKHVNTLKIGEQDSDMAIRGIVASLNTLARLNQTFDAVPIPAGLENYHQLKSNGVALMLDAGEQTVIDINLRTRDNLPYVDVYYDKQVDFVAALNLFEYAQKEMDNFVQGKPSIVRFEKKEDQTEGSDVTNPEDSDAQENTIDESTEGESDD